MSHPSRVRDYFSQQLSQGWTDAILITGCFVTGLLDSAVFNTWSCFVSMQTGNTIYVGLGVSGQPYSTPWRWAKSGTSILSFTIGSFIFARVMRWLDPMRRSTLLISSLFQAILTIVAALLSTLHVVPDADIASNEYIVLLPLGLLAAQAGGQCVLSRVLGYGEVPTVVLTSSFCDVAMDEKLFQGLTRNSKRNRRVLSVVMVVCGAILGGFMTRGGDIAGALWTVAKLKTLMAGVWLLWPSDEEAIRLEEGS